MQGVKDQIQGSGGGGPVEAVYWVTETGTQWRIRGRAYIIADDIETDGDSSGVRTVKSEVGKRMKVLDRTREGEGLELAERTYSFLWQSIS